MFWGEKEGKEKKENYCTLILVVVESSPISKSHDSNYLK